MAERFVGADGRYRSAAGAAHYGGKYRASFLRRWSHRAEAALLRRAVARAGGARTLLDCPCGAGRFLPTLSGVAERVVGADVSPEILRLARPHGTVLEASADALPFREGAFDIVVCYRLLHHVRDRAWRARIFAELARVARRAVVVSFADAATLRARAGRRRGRVSRRAPVPLAELEADAAPLVRRGRVERLSSLFSALAVVVFEKR